MRVLLVEDHPELCEMVASHLVRRGYTVDRAGSIEEARIALAVMSYDGLVLDLGLPDGDGMAILKEARARNGLGLPTLLVTARDAVEDRVRGLDAGADDYIVKPFNVVEFEARLRAVLRRPGPRGNLVLSCGHLTLDLASREARAKGAPVDLTRQETGLLEQLMRAAGRVVVRDALEERLYSFEQPFTCNALEAAVSRLRKRLASANASVRLETKRGIGYRLVAGAGGR